MWFKWAMYGFGHAFEPGIFVQRDDGFWFSSCLFFNFYFSERPRLTNHSFDFSLTCATHFFDHVRMVVWTKPPANIYGNQLLIPAWFEQLFFVVTCPIQSHVFFQYKTDPNNENNILFFPLTPAGPTAPPRAWRAIENIMFHEVRVAGMVIFCLPLPVWNMERTSWLDSLFTVVCRSSIFISATWLNNFSDESIGNCRHLIACQCFLITCMPDCCLGSYLHTQGAQRSCVDCRA